MLAVASVIGSVGSKATPPPLNTVPIVSTLNPTGAGVKAPGTRSCADAAVADADSAANSRRTTQGASRGQECA